MSQPTQPGQDVPDELVKLAIEATWKHDPNEEMPDFLAAIVAAIRKDERAKVAEELRTQGRNICGMCSCGTDAIERTIALWETR